MDVRVDGSGCYIANGWGKVGLIGILVSLRNPAELSMAKPSIFVCILHATHPCELYLSVP